MQMQHTKMFKVRLRMPKEFDLIFIVYLHVMGDFMA